MIFCALLSSTREGVGGPFERGRRRWLEKRILRRGIFFKNGFAVEEICSGSVSIHLIKIQSISAIFAEWIR